MFSLFVNMAKLLTIGTQCLGRAILRAIIEEIDLSQKRALIRGKMEKVLKNAPLLITVDEMDPEDMIIKFEQQQKIYGLYEKNILNSVEKDKGENKSKSMESKLKNEKEIDVKHELSKLAKNIRPSQSKTSVGSPFGIISNTKEQEEHSEAQILDSKDKQNSSKDENVWINTILDSMGISIDSGKKKSYSSVITDKIDRDKQGKKDEAEFAVKQELIKAGHTPNPLRSQQTTPSAPSAIIMKLREQREKEGIRLEEEKKLKRTSKTQTTIRAPAAENSWVENLTESFFGTSFKEHSKPEEKPLAEKQSSDQKQDEKSNNNVKFSSVKGVDNPSLKSLKSETAFNRGNSVNFIQKTASPLSPKPKTPIPVSKSNFGNKRSIDNIEFTNFVAFAKPIKNDFSADLAEEKKPSKNVETNVFQKYPNFKMSPSKQPKSINKFNESKKTSNVVKTFTHQAPPRNVKQFIKSTENKVGSGEFPKKVRMSSVKNEFSVKKTDFKSEYISPFNNKIPLNQLKTSAQGEILPRYAFNKFSTSNRHLTDYKERLSDRTLSDTSTSENKLDRNKGEKKYLKYVGPEPKSSSSLNDKVSEKFERKRISSFSLKNNPRVIESFLKNDFPKPAESFVKNVKQRSTMSLPNLDASTSTGSFKYGTLRSTNSSINFDAPRFSKTFDKHDKSKPLGSLNKTNIPKSTISANKKDISYLDASKFKKSVIKSNSILSTSKRAGAQKSDFPESRAMSFKRRSDNKSVVQNDEQLKLNIRQLSNKSIIRTKPTTKSSVPSKIVYKNAVLKIH